MEMQVDSVPSKISLCNPTVDLAPVAWLNIW